MAKEVLFIPSEIVKTKIKTENGDDVFLYRSDDETLTGVEIQVGAEIEIRRYDRGLFVCGTSEIVEDDLLESIFG